MADMVPTLGEKRLTCLEPIHQSKANWPRPTQTSISQLSISSLYKTIQKLLSVKSFLLMEYSAQCGVKNKF